MKKFSMDWLIRAKKRELNQIEMELMESNAKIAENYAMQDKNKATIMSLREELYSCVETSKIPSIIRGIDVREANLRVLATELEILLKEREMIKNRYNDKNIEIKVLEKAKDKFITKEKYRLDKRDEAEINQLSLTIRKDE